MSVYKRDVGQESKKLKSEKDIFFYEKADRFLTAESSY